MDEQRTQFIPSLNLAAMMGADERIHCLEVIDGPDFGRRYVVPPDGITVGRSPPCELVFADPQMSRSHCRLAVSGGQLMVADLKSTNGVFVDGARVVETSTIPVGSVLQIGRQSLKHHWRTPREVEQASQLDRDLEMASAYVKALLPSRITEGPIRADWVYEPSAKLGGDAFGYTRLSEHKLAVYLIDVSGHGAAAAMHSVTVMNVLRQGALPNTDFADPSAVLGALNDMFQMEAHSEMYFTMWYGVFDSRDRRLDFASGGHHPAYVRDAWGGDLIPLGERNLFIGAAPGKRFRGGSVVLPKPASLYLFSDGVFEIVTVNDVQWSLKDFLALVPAPSKDGLTECQRLHQEVVAVARPGGLDDDFSLVVMTFD